MENYEQKYKEALNWMRSIYPTMQGTDREDAEHHFPELKETEDGKIRKEIIEYITRYKDCITDKEYDSWIAWLEKQGEQEPSWSEEDEKMIRSIWCYLNEFGNWLSDKNDERSKSIYKACDWLKSLKPNHWKPSEEQMRVLQIAIKDYGICHEKYVLESLYNNLKNL